MILFGEGALRKAIREFVVHYHCERNHQGIGNLLIVPDRGLTHRHGPVRCRQRLGGMLKYYDRAA
jgi:putative transposase